MVWGAKRTDLLSEEGTRNRLTILYKRLFSIAFCCRLTETIT